MADDSNVRVQRAGAVARIEMHRPEALNAWTAQLGTELLSAVRTASADETVRAVLVTGAGRAFSAGADVKDAREILPDGTPDLSVRLKEIYNPIVLEIRAAPKPFVAAVNGPAAGLGVSLALACDLVLAAESAYFLLAFVHIAVMPDAGALRFLAERVGLVRAAELAMLGERLPAARAQEWGLVNAVHPDADLLGAAEALCARLAAGPTLAHANIKRTLTETTQAAFADQLDVEANRQHEHAATFDYSEGRAAFAQKRKPLFQGR